jgi:hypothetical protein
MKTSEQLSLLPRGPSVFRFDILSAFILISKHVSCLQIIQLKFKLVEIQQNSVRKPLLYSISKGFTYFNSF